MAYDDVLEAARAIKKAEENLRVQVEKAFPAGSTVAYEYHGHEQIGLVLNHGSIGRTGHLRVENEKTGGRYWITMYNVFGYIE